MLGKAKFVLKTIFSLYNFLLLALITGCYALNYLFTKQEIEVDARKFVFSALAAFALFTSYFLVYTIITTYQKCKLYHRLQKQIKTREELEDYVIKNISVGFNEVRIIVEDKLLDEDQELVLSFDIKESYEYAYCESINSLIENRSD